MTRAPSSRLEYLAVLHVGLLLIFASWAFGGNVDWARSALTLAGNAGILVLVAAVRERLKTHRSLRALHILWPLLGLNLLVLLSLFQPNLQALVIEGGQVFVLRDDTLLGPASARPAFAWRALLLFNALFLPCFNLVLTVRRQRLLGLLLVVLAANAVGLAIFGSLQSLLGSTGPYFGAVESPNPRFFASFIYRNHWGAYAVLGLAACLALRFRECAGGEYRDRWHSPASAATVAILLLAASVPLSGSRACSTLALLLIGGCMIHRLRQIAQRRRPPGARTAWRIIAAGAALVVSAGSVYWIAETTIKARVDDSQQQIAQLRADGSFSRTTLYRDTWRMARDRPVFGWGLDSYGTVFTVYNSQSSPVDGLPVHYENAHSDWLQWLAETGVCGTACLLLLIIGPFFACRGSRPASPVAAYLLAGCALILAYSLIEFPFANPAVLLCFWACLFIAIRWSQLEPIAPQA